jgi:hypothetical protein
MIIVIKGMGRRVYPNQVEWLCSEKLTVLLYNRPCCYAADRVAMQQTVLLYNRPCCYATGRVAIQQAVLLCNRPCCYATDRVAKQQTVELLQA